MANTARTGIRFVKMKDSGVTVPPIEIKEVANNYGTAICKGDPVKLVSDGTIAVAAAGDAWYGVADGIERYKADGVLRKGNRLPANTTFTPTTVGSAEASLVRVIPAKGAIFEADVDTAASALATAIGWVGNNCDFAAGAGGNTTSGVSSYVLDTSSPGTGTAQARVIGWKNYPGDGLDNDISLVNAKAYIVCNEGQEPFDSATGV